MLINYFLGHSFSLQKYKICVPFDSPLQYTTKSIYAHNIYNYVVITVNFCKESNFITTESKPSNYRLFLCELLSQ